MTLSDRAKEAREKADLTGDPYDVALAAALECAEDAEAQRIVREAWPMEPMEQPPPPPITEIRVPKPGSCQLAWLSVRDTTFQHLP